MSSRNSPAPTDSAGTTHFHAANVAEMHPVALYRVLQLRTDVFVVEQDCAYPELDGRDIETSSLMVWADRAHEVIATLRILRDHGGEGQHDVVRIGRVTVRSDHRGTGLARELFQFALEECERVASGLPIVLDAQAPLEAWYGAFGFVRTGPTFLEDDIAHVPMRRG